MKKLIVVALWIYLLGSIVGCSYSPTISQPSREIEGSNDKFIASTSTTTATSTPVPTQTITPSPTITPTPTPTATPTATPIIKQGNEVISRDNVEQLTLLGQIGKGVVYDIAWSADKKLIVLGTGIGINIYNSATLVQEKFIQTSAQVISVDISPDNKTVISGNYSGEVELWDVSSGQKINHLHQWLYPGDGGANVAFSPDGLKIASIGMEESGNYYMVLWDVSSGEESQKFFLGDPFTGIEYFAFSTDGNFVAIGGTSWLMSRLTNEVETSEKKVFIWDIKEEKLLQTLVDSTNEKNNIIGAGFSTDNSSLWVAYSNNIIAYWDLLEEELINKRELEIDGFIINYSQDGSLMAASENYSQFDFYEVENERKINSLSGHSDGGVSSLYFLDDERIAAVIGSNFNVFDIYSGEIQSNYFSNHSASAISPDGEMIALINSEDDFETISLIDFISGNETFSLEDHTKRIGSLAFSPDQKLLASGGRDNKALIWDVETGNLLDTFNIYDYIGELAFSPDSQKLAVCTQEDVQVWDISLGLLESILTGYHKPHSGFSSVVAFSPDGVMLASGNYFGPIHLFYIPTGVLLKYFEGHTETINSLAFSSDGSLLASASRDHSIRFWNIETGDEIGIIEDLPGSINSIIFSLDGKKLISGGEDGIIRFWGIP